MTRVPLERASGSFSFMRFLAVAAASAQQMRGRSSPPGWGRMACVPISVVMTTRPGWSATTSPMIAAFAEYGPCRRASSTACADSYIVKQGDVIALTEKSKASPRTKEIAEANAARVVPKWLDMDKNTAQGEVIALPERDDIDYEVEEHLIVELYSK